ncbi:MAG: ABC transporter ATP-binding protein [Syntrophales bacterium]|jgi:oligopeptide/dipeptide ABC transporter ATP-binding protein|nr:ABC transporter ATP-binding protein [Syntrophales bacterium]
MTQAILDIRGLKTHFFTNKGVVKAVDGVDIAVREGETTCLVGESGCGKSMTALSIMRLVPEPQGRIVEGSIVFEGKDLVAATEAEMREIRGNRISMVFQEPMTSLNPVLKIGEQIAEAVELHQGLRGSEAWKLAGEMLRLVGIPAPETRVNEYPHQMSGGMRQRVMIAMALSCRPRLLIADEPTTALDVTIQAQILDLISRLKEQIGSAVLLITHNLGVVAEVGQSVAVMYAGRIVEYADVVRLFSGHRHPYTAGLFASLPRACVDGTKGRLQTIRGVVPDLLALPQGCSFADRCPEVFAKCRERMPDLVEVETGHWVRCWLYA